MSDFDRQPGSIDDPGGPGGQDVGVRDLPPGDTADDTVAPGEPQAAELDLPGPNDPVAWNYVEPGTEVIGGDGERVGRVDQMVGTDEGIFHGVSVRPDGGGAAKIVPANDVLRLTPARVEISLSRAELDAADDYVEPGNATG
ncbi:MAG TPA: PRC-barrel domain-containing protein [Candidatus Limnocylindria bacterium]|nr:PRC-barrel domain-containing protein [Candidatus Limnocylindria bacterium]